MSELTPQKIKEAVKNCTHNSCKNCGSKTPEGKCELEEEIFDFIENNSNTGNFETDFLDFYHKIKEKYANSQEDECWICLSDVTSGFMRRQS